MSVNTGDGRTGLLVVDVQSGFFTLPVPLYRGAEVIEAIRGLVRRARAAGCPVVFVQHESDPGGPFARQSEGWRILPDVAPEDGDVVIGKQHADAFAGTSLEDVLRGAGVTRVVVCGFATEGCVDTTVRRARSLGFSVEVAEDGHSTTDGPVLSAAQTVRHHNQVFRIFADVTPSDRIQFSAGSPAPVHPDRNAVGSPSVRKLIVSTFMSLDGVVQAPGGPDEDPTGGFALGGWMFAYADDSVDISTSGFDGKDRELVLGRRTYEIFDAYWPYQPQDHPIAQTLNAAKKHIASRTLTALSWNNSTLLRGDVVSAIAALKSQPGLDLQVIGSGNLVRTLQAAALIDEYHVWTFAVVLGRGKRFFGEHAWPSALRLVRHEVSASGVVVTTYVPAGDIQSGTFESAATSEKELARRGRMARGTW